MLFIVVGDDVASLSLSVSLSSVAVVVRCCASSVVVRRPLLFSLRCCPSSVLVRGALLRGVASLALRLAMGEVDVGERGWFSWALVVVCGLLRPCRVFVAVVSRSRCCVGRLLSFLNGWDRLRGRGLSDVTWERSGGEQGGRGLSLGGRSRLWERRWRGGGSLKR